MNCLFKEWIIKNVKNLILYSAAVLFLAGCSANIGLGEAVDTQAPSLEISYPPSNAIIRDSFVLYGKWDDDKDVKKIIVSVRKYKNDGSSSFDIIKTVDAYVNRTSEVGRKTVKDRWWSLELNDAAAQGEGFNGWEFADGVYEVSVTAIDESNHRTNVTRPFEIDNTSPLFVVSKPGAVVKSDVAASKYGTIFSITGTIAEDHEVSALDMLVYDADGDLINTQGPYGEKNVSIQGGTSVTIARYSASEGNKEKERYTTLYGNSLEGTKRYSCSVTLKDNAQAYKNPTGKERTAEEQEADSAGNTTSAFYLYDDVYSDLQSSMNGAGLSIDNIKNVLNDTFGDEDIANKGAADHNYTVAQVKERMDKYRHDGAENENDRLAFTLNPASNPTYIVSGYSFDITNPAAGKSASSGSVLSINYNVGLDGTGIKPNTFKVWLKKIGSKAFAENLTDGYSNGIKDGINDEIAEFIEDVKIAENSEEIKALEDSSNSDKKAKIKEKFVELISKKHTLAINGDNFSDVLNTNSDSWHLLFDNSEDNSAAATSSEAFEISMPSEGIQLNSYYIILLTGHDIDGMDFNQDSLFGFIGNISGVAPEVVILSPDNLSYKATSDYVKELDDADPENPASLKFTGTIKENTSEMSINSIDVILTVKNEESGAIVGEILKASIKKDINTHYQWENKDWLFAESKEGKEFFTFIPSKLANLSDDQKVAIGPYGEGIAGKKFMYTINVTGTSSSGHSSSQERSVHIDSIFPEIEFSSVTPVVEGEEYDKSENKYINGKTKIKARISEANLEKVDWEIWASTDLEKELSAADKLDSSIFEDCNLGKVDSAEISFDTVKVTEFFEAKGSGKDPAIKTKIVINATDIVNNKTTSGSETYIIKQETDRPRITFSDGTDSSITELYKTVDGAQKLTVGEKNLFGRNSNNTISITFNDDDKVCEYEITIYKYDEKGTPGDISDDEKILLTTDSEGWREINKSNPVKDYLDKTSGGIKYTLPEKNGIYLVEIKAKDYVVTALDTDENHPYGTGVAGPFFVAVDSGVPNVSLVSPVNNEFVGQGQILTVKGSVSKFDGTSLRGCIYDADDELKTPLAQLENISINPVAVNDLFEWTASIKMPEDATGDYKLVTVAEDRYGQSSSVTVNLKVDTVPPEVIFSNIAGDFKNLFETKILSEDNPYFSANGYTPGTTGKLLKSQEEIEALLGNPVTLPLPESKGYLVSGTWSDLGGQGTKSMYFALASGYDENGEPNWWYEEEVTGVAQSTAKTSFNFYVPLLKEHNNVSIKVWGVDGAGNKTETVTYGTGEGKTEDLTKVTAVYGISLDFQKPVVKIVKYGDVLSDSTSIADGAVLKTVEDPYYIDAYFVDSASSIPSSAALAFTTHKVSDGSGAEISLYDDSEWNSKHKATFKVTGIADESTVDLFVGAADAHFRPSAERDIKVSYDKSAPRLAADDYDSFYAAKSVELSGTIEDGNFSTNNGYLDVLMIPVNGISAVKKGAVTYTPVTADKYEWKANFTGLEDIEYNVAFIAKDTFGNYSVFSTDSSYVYNADGKDIAATKDSVSGKTVDSTGKVIEGSTVNIDVTAPYSTSTLKTAAEGQKVVYNKAVLTVDEGKNYYSIDSNKTYYTNGKFTLGGVITETNLVTEGEGKPSLTVSFEGGDNTAVPFTTGGNREGEWSYFADITEDGTYEYTLKLKDNADQSFEKTVIVIVDTKAPSVSFTSPSEGESFESYSTISARLAYADEEIGVAQVEKKIINLSDSSSVDSYTFNQGSSTGVFSFTSGLTDEGSFKITASVSDWLGNTSEEIERIFYFDKSKPSLTETSVGNDGITTNAGTIVISGEISDTNALYYDSANNTYEGAVVISATVNGIEKTWSAAVNVADSRHASYSYTFYTAKNSAGKTAEDDDYLEDGSYVFNVTGKDTASKTTQLSRSVKVDTEAPLFGNGTSDTGDPSYSEENVVPHVSTPGATGKDGKIWYNSSDLRIAGTAADKNAQTTGTGIARVYYQTSTKSSSQWGSWTTDEIDLAGTKNWSGTVSAAVHDSTRILLTVKDNAGNTKETTLGPWNIDVNAPDLTDGSVKTGSSAEDAVTSASKRSNGKSDIYVSFKARDDENGSGIKEVYILPYAKISGISQTAENRASYDESNDVYYKTINKESITGSGTVYGRIIDYAGNYSDVTLFAIDFDNTPPAVVLNAPADADSSTIAVTEVNGKLSLHGTASDNNAVSEITGFEYWKSEKTVTAEGIVWSVPNKDSVWTDITAAVTIEGNYSFDISNFDTTGLADETYYYLRASAVDIAGNTGYSIPVKVYISQITDIPAVKITNLTVFNGEYIVKYGTNAQLIGTIADDDSTSSRVVEKLIIAERAVTAENADSITNLATVNYTTGDWTFSPSDPEDGKKTYYIYVKDNNGSVFYVTNTAELAGASHIVMKPKIVDNNTSVVLNAGTNGALNYQSDSKSPEVLSGLGLSYKANGTANGAPVTANNVTVYNGFETLGASLITGGSEKQKIQLKISAKDASGIDGMTMDIYWNGKARSIEHKYLATAATIGGHPVNTAQITYTTDGTFTSSTDGSSNAVWTTSLIDVSEIPTGSVSIKIDAYDGAGLTGNGMYSFIVDNTGPVLRITSPAAGSEITEVTFSGMASDSGGSSVDNVYWMIPDNTEKATANSKETDEKLSYIAGLSWQGGKDSLDNGSSLELWQFNLDGIRNAALKDFDSTSYSEPTRDGVYPLTVYFKATDSLGNYTIIDDFRINHNPDGDKPKTSITYPTANDYEAGKTYVTLGGTIRVTGTVEISSDNANVHSVYLQVDADNNGDFDDDDKAKMLGNGEGHFGYSLYNAAAETGNLYTAYDVISIATGTTVSAPLTREQLTRFGFVSSLEYEAAGAVEAEITAAANAKAAAWWGIKATLTNASWNINLNSDGKLDPGEDEEPTAIKIHACGMNTNGKIGAWGPVAGSEINIKIDAAAPTSEASFQKVEFSSTANKNLADATVTQSASQIYAADTYLKGSWYLVINVLDESGISLVSVKESKTGESGTTNQTAKIELSSGAMVQTAGAQGFSFYYKQVAKTVNNIEKQGYDIYIPIDEDISSASYTVTIQDSDTSAHTTYATYSVKVDNVAPAIDSLLGNGVEIAADSVVNESQYRYMLSGVASDLGSGFERAVFYYYRSEDYASTPVVLDPMITTSQDDAKSLISDLDSKTITQGSGESARTYTLYGKNVTGSMSSTQEFKMDSETSNTHIRKGGLIYIGGVYRTITDISGGVVTFTPACSGKDETEAFFAYAQVVNNTQTESLADNGIRENPINLTKDDGDGMFEAISKTGTTWTWEAYFHSSNMSDGPASVYVLVFDAAGNVNGVEYKVMISNNAPRLAKVFLGTDLNSNNDFSSNEFVCYNIIEENGSKERYTLDLEEYPAGVFTAKDKLAVVPEFTGGNGDILMVYKKDAESDAIIASADGTPFAAIGAVKAQSAEAENVSITSTDSTYTISAGFAAYKGNDSTPASGSSALIKKTGFAAFIIPNTNLAGGTVNEAADGTGKAFSLSFWDSTEETEQGTSSQSCAVLVKNFALDLTDETQPKVAVNPFWWNKNDDNSIYGNSTDNGHIELESDWENATGYNSEATSGVADGDPKVSGKITFTGTAYDEHSLSSLWVYFGNKQNNVTFTPANYLTGQGVENSVNDTGSDTITESDESTAAGMKNAVIYQAAYYDAENTTWNTAAATMASDGWEFEVFDAEDDDYGNYDDTVYYNQNGHKVYWKLSIDTSRISTVAATDVKAYVLALDSSANRTAMAAAGTAGEDASFNKPSYRVDVVPYVTDVKTVLSAKKANNWSLYGRSALGDYIVAEDETIKIFGFNLYSSSVTPVIANMTVRGNDTNASTDAVKAYAKDTAELITADAAHGKYVIASIGNGLTSGALQLTVSSIGILNNSNNDDATGSYEAIAINKANIVSGTAKKDIITSYAYNRKPNGDSNNILTDNVKLSVWKINKNAARVESKGLLKEPVMKINPVNGILGFNFVNGPAYASMANGTKNSYTRWQRNFATYRNSAMAFDDNGDSHGIITGMDTNPNSGNGHGGRMTYQTSRWGVGNISDQNGNYDGTKTLRLESISTGSAIMEERFHTPTLAVATHYGVPTVYLAYYDDINQQIRFRYGNEYDSGNNKLAGTLNVSTFRTTNNTDISNRRVLLLDSGSNVIGSAVLGARSGGTGNRSYVVTDAKYNGTVAYVTDIAKKGFGQFEDQKDSNGNTVTTNNGFEPPAADYSLLAGGSTGQVAGEFVDIAVIPGATEADDIVVATWYDNSGNGSWKYAFKKAPCNDNDMSATHTDGYWSAPVVLAEEAGEYCKIAVDADKGVHIVCASGASTTYYVYLSAANAVKANLSASDFKVVTVDSYGLTGEYLSIDTAKSAKGNVIPYISCYMASTKMPRYSYLVETSAGVDYTADGVNSNGEFTGNWEVMLVPTTSSVREDNTNVGVWKTAAGVIKNSTYTLPAGGTVASNAASGIAVGNGTAYPILGYATKTGTSGNIETAQMK